MEKIKTIKGTHDILGKESEIHDFIIKFSEDICRAFNFQKISTPIIEDSMVFQRTLGDSTDIISKEMYSFVDSGGDKITLRPEGTAPITRCMISNSLFEELNQHGYIVEPGDLGENITTKGIDLINLPKYTHLKIGDSVILEVTGLRNPCRQIEDFGSGLLKKMISKDAQGKFVRKTGIMTIVKFGGFVSVSDNIEVLLPKKPFVNLDIV